MDIQETLNAYAELMEEIKGRHQLLMQVTLGQFFLPNWAVAEFGQLQIRKICELLAIACLIAHGDIEATRGKLAKAYEADKIFNLLGKLHGHFYPQPSRQLSQEGQPGLARFQLEMITDGFLTKDELIKSYHTAAGFLHRGNLTSILGKKTQSTTSNYVIDWGNKLTALLNHHQIYLIDPPGTEPLIDDSGQWAPRNQFIIMMNANNTGKVQAVHFKNIGKKAPGDGERSQQ